MGRLILLTFAMSLCHCGQSDNAEPSQRLEAGNTLDVVRVALVQQVSAGDTLGDIANGPVLQSGLDLPEWSYDGTHYAADDYVLTVRGEPPVYRGTTVEATGQSRGSVHLTLEFRDISRDNAIISP